MANRHNITFNTEAEYNAFKASSGYVTPNVSYIKETNEVHYNPVIPHDYSQDYFTTIALENGTISFNIWYNMGTDYITSISYSTDNGETWNTTNNVNDKEENLQIDVDVNNGDKVLWKGNAQQLGYYDEDESYYIGSFFSSDCEFNAEGNVMSMLYGDNFYGETTLEQIGELSCLFSDYYEELACNIVDASKMVLPATTLANNCYWNMFKGCTSLTTAPELPATTLAGYCYEGMFSYCTSLTTAPSTLPATTLANDCYSSMFMGCTSLTTAPSLLATTLANFCYSYMFYGCTSLTTAPELPATALTERCYQYMFNGCTSLNSITCLATDISATDCTKNWVFAVANSGTFTKAASMSSWTTGINGIPSNWTVQDAS